MSALWNDAHNPLRLQSKTFIFMTYLLWIWNDWTPRMSCRVFFWWEFSVPSLAGCPLEKWIGRGMLSWERPLTADQSHHPKRKSSGFAPLPVGHEPAQHYEDRQDAVAIRGHIFPFSKYFSVCSTSLFSSGSSI